MEEVTHVRVASEERQTYVLSPWPGLSASLDNMAEKHVTQNNILTAGGLNVTSAVAVARTFYLSNIRSIFRAIPVTEAGINCEVKCQT